jgi:hypothetical protein
MNPSPGRPAAALAAIMLAAIFLAGCASARGGSAAPVSPAVAQPGTVLVDCSGHQQTRPSSFVLTCADANDALTALHWVGWAASQAFGTGTETVNTCTPDCADGKLVSYPALITLWRPEPLSGHPGVRYFTRITRIYPAARPPLYNCQGTRTCYPQTSTFDLSGAAALPARTRGSRGLRGPR